MPSSGPPCLIPLLMMIDHRNADVNDDDFDHDDDDDDDDHEDDG